MAALQMLGWGPSLPEYLADTSFWNATRREVKMPSRTQDACGISYGTGLPHALHFFDTWEQKEGQRCPSWGSKQQGHLPSGSVTSVWPGRAAQPVRMGGTALGILGNVANKVSRG